MFEFFTSIYNYLFSRKVAAKKATKSKKSKLFTYVFKIDFIDRSMITPPETQKINNRLLNEIVLQKMVKKFPSPKSIQIFKISKKTNKVYPLRDKNKNYITLDYIARNN